jgi:hypothetical protein
VENYSFHISGPSPQVKENSSGILRQKISS